jgi:hypothetical protein
MVRRPPQFLRSRPSLRTECATSEATPRDANYPALTRQLGVLWSGDHCFPGTVETLELLRKNGAQPLRLMRQRMEDLTLV